MKTLNKTSIISIITILTIFSCKNESKEVTIYNGSGKIDHVKYFSNSNDSLNYQIKYFHESGKIKCEGQKINGKKNNKWKYYNNEGIIQSIENFSNGLLSDTQTYFFSDGKLNIYKILDKPIQCFCDSCKNYSYKQISYWRNGNLREINHIKNCDFNGKIQLYDSLTGVLQEEFFEINGLKSGLYKKFYLDSSIMVGHYENDKPVGKWKTIKGDSILSEKDYK